MPQVKHKASKMLSPQSKPTFDISRVDLNRFATADSKQSPLAMAAQKQATRKICSKLNLDQPERSKMQVFYSEKRKETKDQLAKEKSRKKQIVLGDHVMF